MHSSPFAGGSVGLHYARGAVGLVALAVAVALAASGVPAALGLLIVTAVAWRGCPTCWAVGLAQTREREGCAGGRCGPRAST